VTDNRLALIVRSAFRGMMEAVLATDGEDERPANRLSISEPDAQPDEIAFPSVTAAEETLFGETPPPTFGMTSSEAQIMADMERRDLDAVLAARARERAYAEQNLQPQHQGGPGEREAAEWLRLPQT
jgi:hypothetical protein